MPAPVEAFEAVANVLGGVPKGNAKGLANFFEHEYPVLPEEMKNTVGEWLASCDYPPDEAAIAQLKAALADHLQTARACVQLSRIIAAAS
jgi:hypothetical protein